MVGCDISLQAGYRLFSCRDCETYLLHLAVPRADLPLQIYATDLHAKVCATYKTQKFFIILKIHCIFYSIR